MNQFFQVPTEFLVYVQAGGSCGARKLSVHTINLEMSFSPLFHEFIVSPI